MNIPYVIDNVTHRLVDVIDAILRDQPGAQVDVATAYFSVGGFQQVRHTLPGVRQFRLQPDASALLRQPLVGAAVSRLRDALHDYGTSSDAAPLIATVQGLYTQQGQPIPTPRSLQPPLARTDLHLVCYEYVI